MKQIFKNSVDQSQNIVENFGQPFDTNSISQKKGQRPRDLLGSYRLTQMSPNDYYKFVSHHTGFKPEDIMKQREKEANEISVADMRKMMREGTKFDTPWLRLMDRGEPKSVNPYWQEGLHRMLAAGQEYGMDTKFPVFIGYENDPWDELDKMSMDDFLKHYDDTRSQRWNNYLESQKEEEEERQSYWKREAADHFKIPEEQVTQKHIDEYMKYLDWIFKDEWLK